MRRRAYILGVGGLVALLLATAAVRLRSSWRSLWSAYSYQLMAMIPHTFDVSPSGRTLVFTAKGSGGRDLYALDLASGQISQVTSSPLFEAEVRFLNETTVAVTAVEDPSDAASTWSLYEVRRGESGGWSLARLTSQSGIWDSGIVPLSPDEILFQRSQPRKLFNPVGGIMFGGMSGFFKVYGVLEGIYVMNRQTGAVQQVAGAYDIFAIRCAEGVIFKDRRRVIMENVGSTTYLDLVTLNAPLGSPKIRQVQKRRLARSARSPVLSPNERFVYFVREEPSGYAIVRMDLDTFATTRLTVRNNPVSTLRATNRHLFFLEGPSAEVRLWGDKITLWRLALGSKQLEKVLSPEQFVNPSLLHTP